MITTYVSALCCASWDSLVALLADLFRLADHLRLILAASLSKMRSSSVDHPVKVGLGRFEPPLLPPPTWRLADDGLKPDEVDDDDVVGGPTAVCMWTIWVGLRPPCNSHVNSSAKKVNLNWAGNQTDKHGGLFSSKKSSYIYEIVLKTAVAGGAKIFGSFKRRWMVGMILIIYLLFCDLLFFWWITYDLP